MTDRWMGDQNEIEQHQRDRKATTLTDQERIAELERFVEKVNGIRNSIVGRQGFNWSMHAYPLVIALREIGCEGIGYEEAKQLAEDEADRWERHLETKRIAELERERDEAQGQVAALRHGVREACDYSGRNDNLNGLRDWSAHTRMLQALLTDTESTARAYTERIRAEAMEELKTELFREAQRLHVCAHPSYTGMYVSVKRVDQMIDRAIERVAAKKANG